MDAHDDQLLRAAGLLPEFSLSLAEDGFTARARYEITRELEAQDCLGVVRAATLPELLDACHEERMKRARAEMDSSSPTRM